MAEIDSSTATITTVIVPEDSWVYLLPANAGRLGFVLQVELGNILVKYKAVTADVPPTFRMTSRSTFYSDDYRGPVSAKAESGPVTVHVTSLS